MNTSLIKRSPVRSAPPNSEGQRRLQRVPGSLSQIARAVGVSKTLVVGWLAGRRRPGAEVRTRLHAVFGVPPGAWDLLPGTNTPRCPATAPRVSAAAVQHKPIHPPLPPLLPADVDRIRPPTTLECVDDAQRVLRVLRKTADLPSAELVRIVSTQCRLLEVRIELERAAAMRDDLAVRNHPSWQRLERFIFKTLEPHPAALAELKKGLRR